MKKRVLYSFLFGIPGLGIATIAAFMVFGAAAGFFWIFLFGDSPWPPATRTILLALFLLVFLALWAGFIFWGYRVGKRLEADPALNIKHILLSAGVTGAVLLLIGLHQLSVGNLGPRSDGELCSDFCGEKGYQASGLTPRNAGTRICSCYDRTGQAVITVRLDDLPAGKGD